MFASTLRNLDAGLQQAIYYAIFIDFVVLVSLGVFIWCCCVYVLNYKRLVGENVRVKRSERQYYGARAEKERLEARRLRLELGLLDEFNGIEEPFK
mgnify:CR=1 FL=1|jgi:hypothetical protein